MTSYKPLVLCVDDEPHVLEGLVANLRRRFAVKTATSGASGLQAIEDSEEDFACVVSDMRMPGMDGASFLAEVRQRAPDTTRLLLTGHANLESAVAAVNDGGIFRFLTKPCPPEQLLVAVGDACRQFQLRRAERELLEETLKGTVSVLSEVISLASPEAYGR
ncbi:MAG: response regulator, partial [Myxococcota bacterium]